MTKDYAKRKKTKKQQRPYGLWIFTGLFLCLFVAGLVYLKYSGKSQPQAPVEQKAKPTKKAHFEFYNTLSKKTVKAPVTSQQYYLQIASFKDVKQLDGLKAQLTIMGFDVVVKKVKAKGEDWYRLQVGPYTSLASVDQAKSTLKENGLESLLIQRGQVFG